jgi:hypothetical protein
MVLNVSYVCLHAFLLRQESPDPDPGRRAPHFLGGSVAARVLEPKGQRQTSTIYILNDNFVKEKLSLPWGQVG